MRKKFNLIALTDFISEILIIYSIRVIKKFNDITHQVKSDKVWWYNLLNRI